MKLIIEDDEGRKTVVPIVREEITIGRQDGNTIKLTERNVSRRHARLIKENGSLVIEDLGSYNGVRVNGDRITGPTKVKEGDLIEIGDYDLGVQGKIEAITPPPGQPQPKFGMRTIPPSGTTGPQKAVAAVQPPPAASAVPLPAQPPPGSAATPSAAAGGATAIIRVSDIMKDASQAEARDLPKNEMPRLVGLSGNIRGKEFYLMRTDVKVGRSEDNDIAIDHQSMSRQHARFVLEDGGWKVIDNKSANGVHINGELYAVSAVKPGDTVELGHLKFRFCAPGEKFTPPAEKSEADAAKPGGLRPTTAELIAGARPEARPASAAKKSKLPLVAGGIGALAAAGIAAFLLAGRGKPAGEESADGDLSAAEAVKAGDREFKKKEFLRAVEFYDAAAAKGENPPNRKKAQEEARGQEVNRDLDRAVAAGDFDKAKGLYDKCAAETTWYCQKAQEKGDLVKAGYAKAHLAKAQTAKAAGKVEACQQEVQLVTTFDPGNAEAQAVQCAPQPVQAEKAAPSRREGGGLTPSQRDAKAYQLIQEGNAKTTAKDFGGAAAKYQAALDLKPTKQYVGFAYRGLGTAAVFAGDTKQAVKWYKLYLPYADDATRQQVQQLIARYGE